VQTKIQKWGNSLGLRVPKPLAEEAGVAAGSEVDISVEDGDLIVRPSRRPRYELGELLGGYRIAAGPKAPFSPIN